jgi:hypothetical protein
VVDKVKWKEHIDTLDICEPLEEKWEKLEYEEQLHKIYKMMRNKKIKNFDQFWELINWCLSRVNK